MDLFQELEKSLRSYLERLPIDVFLPPPDQIPSSLPAETHFNPVTPEDWKDQPVQEERVASPLDFPQSGKKSLEDPEGSTADLQAEIQEFLKRQKEAGHYGPSGWEEESDTPENPREEGTPEGTDPSC